MHRNVEGGGGKKRLTFPGVKAAGDVELGALFFFGLMTKMARRLLWIVVRARRERERASCVESSFSRKRQHDDMVAAARSLVVSKQ